MHQHRDLCLSFFGEIELRRILEYLKSEGFVYDEEFGYKEEDKNCRMSENQALNELQNKGGEISLIRSKDDVLLNFNYIKGAHVIVATYLGFGQSPLTPKQFGELMWNLLNYVKDHYPLRWSYSVEPKFETYYTSLAWISDCKTADMQDLLKIINRKILYCGARISKIEITVFIKEKSDMIIDTMSLTINDPRKLSKLKIYDGLCKMNMTNVMLKLDLPVYFEPKNKRWNEALSLYFLQFKRRVEVFIRNESQIWLPFIQMQDCRIDNKELSRLNIPILNNFLKKISKHLGLSLQPCSEVNGPNKLELEINAEGLKLKHLDLY